MIPVNRQLHWHFDVTRKNDGRVGGSALACWEHLGSGQRLDPTGTKCETSMDFFPPCRSQGGTLGSAGGTFTTVFYGQIICPIKAFSDGME